LLFYLQLANAPEKVVETGLFVCGKSVWYDRHLPKIQKEVVLCTARLRKKIYQTKFQEQKKKPNKRKVPWGKMGQGQRPEEPNSNAEWSRWSLLS